MKPSTTSGSGIVDYWGYCNQKMTDGVNDSIFTRAAFAWQLKVGCCCGYCRKGKKWQLLMVDPETDGGLMPIANTQIFFQLQNCLSAVKVDYSFPWWIFHVKERKKDAHFYCITNLRTPASIREAASRGLCSWWAVWHHIGFTRISQECRTIFKLQAFATMSSLHTWLYSNSWLIYYHQDES